MQVKKPLKTFSAIVDQLIVESAVVLRFEERNLALKMAATVATGSISIQKLLDLWRTKRMLQDFADSVEAQFDGQLTQILG